MIIFVLTIFLFLLLYRVDFPTLTVLLPMIQRSHDTKAYYISVRLFTPPFSPETVQPVWHVEMVTPNGIDRFAKRGIHLHACSKNKTYTSMKEKHQRSGDETMFCFCPGAVGTFVIAVKREGTYSSHVIHRVWALLVLVSLCVCVLFRWKVATGLEHANKHERLICQQFPCFQDDGDGNRSQAVHQANEPKWSECFYFFVIPVPLFSLNVFSRARLLVRETPLAKDGGMKQ